MSQVAAERMSRVDTAWLRMDTDANRMTIIGVWVLKPRLSHAELCARVQDRLLRYDRFRQKVVEDALGAQWVEDDRFDLQHHVRRETLRRRRGQSLQAALQQRVGELAAAPLDLSRPLWQMHLVEDLDGRSALITRIHHCIADGIALIGVMLSIADGGDLPPPRRRTRARAAEVSPDFFAELLGDGMGEWLGGLWHKAAGLAGSLAEGGLPGSLAGSVDVARTGLQLVNDAGALLLMADDSPTRLKGHATPGKRVAWSPPMPLREVKALGKALGCSVNDVLLGCVAGALGDYLRAKGDDPTGQEIRAMVPINLRPPEQAHELGNRFGLAPLVLPIGIANPVERVFAVRQRMQALKGSYQPLLAFGVLAVAGLLIKPMQAALLNVFARKTTAVMTNVPGPAETLRFCGCEVEQVMFWVPSSGDVGMGVSILTYAGGVQFGLITDHALCPDPEAIVARFAPQFEALLLTALMMPWE